MPQNLKSYQKMLNTILLAQSIQPLAMLCYRMKCSSAGLACLILSGLLYFRCNPLRQEILSNGTLSLENLGKDRLTHCSVSHKLSLLIRETSMVTLKSGNLKACVISSFIFNHMGLNSLKVALNPNQLYENPQSEKQKHEQDQAKEAYQNFSKLSWFVLIADFFVLGAIESYKYIANKPSPSF